MTGTKRGSRRLGGLYEPAYIILIGYSLWFAGRELGFFNFVILFPKERGLLPSEHSLLDLASVSCCLTLVAFTVAIRQSFMRRRAVMAQIAAEKLAESIARHDSLTGLANRRFFLESLEERLKSRQLGDEFVVMLIDLDRFKAVNDFHGHAAGNVVLCTVADRLREMVPTRSIVARLGGDEFAVLVPFDGDRDALVLSAEHMIGAVQNPIPWEQGEVDVDATIGITIVRADNNEADAILHAADLAMYQGKREGRGTFRFFHEDMDIATKARVQLEAELRLAIYRSEITPFYQPIVRLASKKLAGFEVLPRWNHPSRGSIDPDIFIPVAEETGMITDLFFCLLHDACLDARNWPSNLELAVHISPRQLQNPQLPHQILALLTNTGFPPNRLEVEITEAALIHDLEAARTALTLLRNFGVKIALDDFGTGYSSIYHLRELRFDKLKIDASYVTSLLPGTERAKLVDVMIQLGTSLSLQTTAEGIETPLNLDWLSYRGCTFGQGHLFGRPMPKEAAERFLDGVEMNLTDAREKTVCAA